MSSGWRSRTASGSDARKAAHPPRRAESYRATVDQAVKLCASHGVWLVLDLHRFGAPKPEHVAFWKDAAIRYKDNPAVLFELFNEPHGISWQVWRDGGNLKGPENKVTDVNVVENTEKTAGETSPGMQALVDAVPIDRGQEHDPGERPGLVLQPLRRAQRVWP